MRRFARVTIQRTDTTSDASPRFEMSVSDHPFVRYHRVKAALIAFGLHAESLAMDTALNTGISLEAALGLVGHWRSDVRMGGYSAALASMRTSDRASQCATDLLCKLKRYAARQYFRHLARGDGTFP